MLENARYIMNRNNCKVHAGLMLKAQRKGDEKAAGYFMKHALKYGNNALGLSQRTTKIGAEDIASVRRIVDSLVGMQESAVVISDLRTLASVVGFVAENPTGALAARMVDSYRIASEGLGDSTDDLRLMYDTNVTPRWLRETILEYAAGKLSREDASKRLAELGAKTERYLKIGGIAPQDPGPHDRASYRPGSLEKDVDKP